MARGRPPIERTPEYLAEQDKKRKEWRDAAKAKTRNITVDADLVDIINERADDLTDKLGFRPTVSQTLRYLLKNMKDDF